MGALIIVLRSNCPIRALAAIPPVFPIGKDIIRNRLDQIRDNMHVPPASVPDRLQKNTDGNHELESPPGHECPADSGGRAEEIYPASETVIFPYQAYDRRKAVLSLWTFCLARRTVFSSSRSFSTRRCDSFISSVKSIEPPGARVGPRREPIPRKKCTTRGSDSQGKATIS